MLGRDGHDVETTDDGEAALELIAREAVEVVILDLQMPKMSGFEFLARLGKLSPERQPAVIVVTGRVTDSNIGVCGQAAVFDTVYKPFEWDVLLRTVAAALESRGR